MGMSMSQTVGWAQLPLALRTRIARELADGERLVWAGRPCLRVDWSDAISRIFFGLLFVCFSSAWILLFGFGAVLLGEKRSFGELWWACLGFPFLLIGFALVFSPFGRWRAAKRACYALTDRRALVWASGRFGRVHVVSYKAADLRDMRATSSGDGTGDVVFCQEDYTYTSHTGGPHGVFVHHTGTHRYGFLAIQRAAEVERLVRETLLA